MKFSMIFEAQTADTSPEGERRTLLSCVEQAVYAEGMGFDRVWAVEHHGLKWYAHMSAPEVFLSHVSARTSRIRIGHGVVCMAFNYNHPVRVAERAATLDILSGGRLDLGAGRGGTEEETSFCGVDKSTTKAQVEESLRMVSRMWLDDRFEWHESFEIRPHHLVPGPIQRPHPPLFLACSHAETVAQAAEYGVGALVLGFQGPEAVADMRKLYDEACATRDGTKFVSPALVNDHLSALCPTIVLDDAAEARRIGVRGQRFFEESIGHWSLGTPTPSLDTADDDNVAALADFARVKQARIGLPDMASIVWSTDHAYGTAGTAIEYVERLQHAGADEIMCLIQMGTVPHEACMETIRQWGTYVIPHFRTESAA